MRIIYIRAAKSRGYIRVGVLDGDLRYDLTVSEADYLEAGSPLNGDGLDKGAFHLLYYSDMRYRARLFALRILSYADNNEKNLSRKLIIKGIDREVAEQTAREMVSLGYINEARQLDRLISEEVNRKLTGPKKLFPKLISKGYSRGDIEAAVDRLAADGQIDFEASKTALLKKFLPPSPTEQDVKKLLYKNGYEIC